MGLEGAPEGRRGDVYVDERRSGVRLSEESIRLWERNTQRYADQVKRGD